MKFSEVSQEEIRGSYVGKLMQIQERDGGSSSRIGRGIYGVELFQRQNCQNLLPWVWRVGAQRLEGQAWFLSQSRGRPAQAPGVWSITLHS